MTTQEQQQMKEKKLIRVGPDQVTITDQEVVIEARHEMPDWDVREFNVVPIYFGDNKYFLTQN